MTLSAKIYGHCGSRPIDPDSRPRPRPRAELRDLKPLDRVLAQLDAMGLEHQQTYSGYAARCPNHLSDPGRLNFEIVEVGRDTATRNGSVQPAGTILLFCQAYGDLVGPDGCTQEKVIKALGLLPSDLFPGDSGRYRPYVPPGRRYRLAESGLYKPPLDDDQIEHWEEQAARFEAAIRGRHAGRLGQLAGQLGVPESALARFHVGWRKPDFRNVGDETVEGQCWTVPEQDGWWRVTAINRRYEDGDKRIMAGGRRGLYVPEGWEELPGPIYCPEGFSDAAALVARGACAVGRPSVAGGVEELAVLLAEVHRPVVILGENDAKPMRRDGEAVMEAGEPAQRHPGYEGAVAACRKLRALLGRDDITVKMPPVGFKDVREFLTHGGGLA